MPTVDIDGFGRVSFPDSMSSAQIESAIRNQIMRSPEYVKAREAQISQKYAGYQKASQNNEPPAPEGSAVGRFFQGSIGDTVNGIVNAVQHPIDTAGNLIGAQLNEGRDAANAASVGDYPSAVMHGVAAVTPLFGPQAVKIGQTIGSGDVARGLGQATALLGAEAAGKLAGKVVPQGAKLGESSRNLYQTALKPSTANSAAAVSRIVDTGIQNKIPISDAGLAKLSGIVDNLNQKIASTIKKGSASGATVDPASVAARVDQLRPTFQNQVNPTSDLASLDAAKQEFLAQHSTPAVPPKPTGLLDAQGNPIMTAGKPAQMNPIPADQAQAIKQGTYKQLRKSYGELKSAQVEAQKAMARGIKEELETQFPEIKGLNAKESQLIGLQSTLERALNRIGNHEPVGLIPSLAVDYGLTIGAPQAAVAGILAKVMINPMVRSKLAIALDAAGRKAGTASKVAQGATTGLARMGQINNRINDYVQSLNSAIAPQQTGSLAPSPSQ